ncbi:MAG: hypothetical protein WAQ22_00410 [Candidatus Saccharimonas sp.]
MNPQQPQNPYPQQPPQAQPPYYGNGQPQPSVQGSNPPAQDQYQSYPYPPQQPIQPYPQPVPAAPAPYPTADSTNNEHYAVDYLNQIAPPTQAKPVNKFAIIGLILGVLTLAVVALLMITGSKPDFSTQARTTLARINTIQALSKAQQSHLIENDLSSMNATLSTSLSSMATELEETMKSSGIKKIELTDTAKKAETAYSDALSTKLEDAYLTGTLDRVYSREMSYQLTILKSQMLKLKNVANKKSLREFYETNSKTLDAAITSFSEFSSSK